MHSFRPIDPVVTFRNSQGEAARGTLTSVQRRSLVMEIYNPYSIVQVSEVLTELTVRSGDRPIYKGKGVVVSLVNTGLMAVVSVSLTDEWSDLNAIRGDLSRVGDEAEPLRRGVGSSLSHWPQLPGRDQRIESILVRNLTAGRTRRTCRTCCRATLKGRIRR